MASADGAGNPDTSPQRRGRGQPAPRPSHPSPHIDPESGDALGRPRLLRITLGGLYDERFDGLLGHRQARTTEGIAEKLKASLNPPDERLVGMFL